MAKIMYGISIKLQKNLIVLVGTLLLLSFILSVIIPSKIVLLVFLGGLFFLAYRMLNVEEEVRNVDVPVTELDLLRDDINKLAKAAVAITNGEVGAKLPSLDGDLGEISDSIQALINTTNQIIQEIDSMSNESAETSRQLEDISTSTSKVMTDLSATLEELTSTTMQLNSSVGDISSGAKEIDQSTVDGMDQLTSLETKMGQIRTESSSASERIMTLNQSAGEMEGIISVITGISKQTNLLALNAAIEAARAGEAGKGFAVVADEVRKLASSTQESLGDIRRLIDEFLIESKEAVSIINTNNVEIEAGSGILSETTELFAAIAERIKSMVVKIEDSSDATSQIASGSQEIASAAALQTESIVEINDLSTTIATMSTEMKDTLSKISVGSSTLELDLDEFDSMFNAITEDEKRAMKKEFDVENNYIIGMIARLEPNKGHEFFIDSLQDTLDSHPKAVVIIAGNGSLESHLERYVESAGISDRVRLVGYRSDVHVILSILDMVVATSINEGTPPRIILEAMAARKPIVSTDVIGAKAVIKNTKHGLLVSHGDNQKLSESMNKLMDKPAVAVNFAVESRKRIEKMHAGL